MSVHVDWLTIVGRRAAQPDDWSVSDAYVTAAEALADHYPLFIEAVENPLRWEIVRPRAPYSYARRAHDATRTLYVHPLATHYTLEITGRHCQTIAGYMPSLCGAFHGMFTRLDLAVDMQCDVSPPQFVKKCAAGRVKTRSEMVSATGQTIYLGARSSERFARVYRYNAPHPRAHLLRAEFQCKHSYANGLALEISKGVPLEQLAAGLGETFGFNHSAWKLRDQPANVKVKSVAQCGNTVHWLTTTVAPLLRRLQRENRLDVEGWFRAYVLEELEAVK